MSVIKTILELRMRDLNDNYPFIDLEIAEDIKELVISITDKELPYALPASFSKIPELGCADSFRFVNLGTNGQRILLSFRIENPGEEKLDWGAFELLDDEVICSVTCTNDEDIIEAIRCIYSVYGYEYVHPQIYQIDSFRDRLKSGRYVSFLARNAHGQTLGHVAIEELDRLSGIMEVCNLVIPSYARGHGVAGKLTNMALHDGELRGLNGLFARPALHHAASQKLLNRGGFTPCGMYFNFVSVQSVQDRTFPEGVSRIHAAYSIHMLNKEKQHRLFLPDECRDFITEIFDREQVPYSVEPGGVSGSAESKFSFDFDTANKRADIIITSIGPDFLEQVEKESDKFDLNSLEVIMVYLPMNDPACPDVYKLFRDFGYIFSGCLPGSDNGDFILLQNLGEIPVSRECIVSEPGYKEMIDRLCTMMNL